MGLLQNLQVFVIKLVCWLGWLSSFALAQMDLSDATSGYLNLPVQGLTCLSNMAVFVTSLIRGRLDLEIGARDALDILVSAKLKTINGIEDGNGLITEQTASAEQVPLQKMFESFRRLLHGLGIQTDFFRRLRHRLGIQKMVELFRRLRNRLVIQKMVELFRRLRHRVGIHIPCFREEEDLETATAGGRPSASNENGSVQNDSVVMLCNGKPNLSIKEFMKTNASIVGSILLRFLPLRAAMRPSIFPTEVTIEMLLCRCDGCNCIVFWTTQEITRMLMPRMPGILKQLPHLPQLPHSLCLVLCLTCHRNGCHGCNSRVDESTAVSGILDFIGAGTINGKGHICICIPLNDAGGDKWTELLVRSLRSKDAESRGVRVMASEALEDYLAGRPTSSRSVEDNTVEYNMVSFIIPRLTEVLINILLTFMFGVDGFSSSLIARRTVRDYLVDSKGSGFAANAFLTKAVVNFDGKVVCQVLTFRGDLLGIKTLSSIICCVNLICSIAWDWLIGFVAVTVITSSQHAAMAMRVAVCIALGMDSIIILTRFTSIAFRFLYIFFFIWTVFPFPIPIPITPFAALCVLLVVIVLVIIWPSSNRKEKMFLFVILTWIGVTLYLNFQAIIFFLLMASGGILIMILGLNSMERVFTLAIILEAAYFQIRSGYGNVRWGNVRATYGAVQILVWVKWTGGSYILSKKNSLEFFGKSPHEWGLLLYSSAFFLNAVSAGVLSEWKTPWIHSILREHHHRNTTTEGALSATP